MKIINMIEKILKVLCIMLLFLITIVAFVQVIARYIFRNAFSWTDEFNIWAMVWMVMLGSTLTIINGSHARIDFFIGRFGTRVKNIFEIFDNIACAIIVCVLGLYSFPVIKMNINNMSTGMQISQAILYMALPVGGIFMILFFLLEAFEKLKAVIKSGRNRKK